MAYKIGICAEKGGVGKTTSLENLGIALAILGKRVLLVDSDSQCSLTKHFYGGDPDIYDGLTYKEENVTTLYNILEEGASIFNTVKRQTYVLQRRILGKLKKWSFSVDILMGSKKLHALAFDGENLYRFREMLEAVEERYDYILFDFGPGWTDVNASLFNACDYIITPVELGDEDSVIGYIDVIEHMNAMIDDDYDHYGHLVHLGMFFTKCKTYKRLNKEDFEEVYQDQEDWNVFDAYIHDNETKCKEAKKANIPLIVMDSSCSASKDYISLAVEIMKRLEDTYDIS